MNTFLIFIVILSVLVFVHELGHFVTARKFGIKVDEFGFGFPPRLIGLVKNDQNKWQMVWGNKELISRKTILSLNWIPIGGFVKIKGENGDNKNEPDSFGSKRIRYRIMVLLAGVAMNILLALFIFTLVFSVGARVGISDDEKQASQLKDYQITIEEVVKDSAADQAKLLAKDEILRYKLNNNQEFIKPENIAELRSKITDQGKNNNSIVFEVSRNNEIKQIEITPKYSASSQNYLIGVMFSSSAKISYPIYKSFWLAIKYTYYLIINIFEALYLLLKNLVVAHKVSDDVTGPVGIAVATGKMAQNGFVYLLQFVALLSVNLAVINVLPFPALDGGRMLFLLLEKVRGKAMAQKIEAGLNIAGFAILILASILISVRDVKIHTNLFENIKKLF